MKSSEILKNAKNTNFVVRVYRNGCEVVLMGEGYDDLTENSEFAILSPGCPTNTNFFDYVDDEHPLKKDRCGSEYVEWLNNDFTSPFSEEDIDERIEYYTQFNN